MGKERNLGLKASCHIGLMIMTNCFWLDIFFVTLDPFLLASPLFKNHLSFIKKHN